MGTRPIYITGQQLERARGEALASISHSDPVKQHLLRNIMWWEGLCLHTYRCTANALTVGWGHNLDALPVEGIYEGNTITVAKANDLLVNLGLARAVSDAVVAAKQNGLNGIMSELCGSAPAVAVVLYDMAFNMGSTRLSKFRRMYAALGRGDFDTAAAEMRDSAWYSQVGRRAKHHVRQVRENNFIPLEDYP